MARRAKAFDPKTFLATVNHGRTLSTLAKDDVVFQQGSPADAVYYISRGAIKVVVTSTQGREAVIAILKPGEFFGEGCLIGAGALITEGKEIPPGSLVMGAPGKVVRTLDDAARQDLLASAERYRANMRRFRSDLRAL